MIDELRLIEAAEDLLQTFRDRDLRIATAESCTGGLVAAFLTEIPGSSDVVEAGFVTYSNDAKQKLLGVPAQLIGRHGAVSEEVARAMAEGALVRSPADVSVAITGIAGPNGGSVEKPIGLVHFAAARRGGQTVHLEEHFGDLPRRQIRLKSVAAAFTLARAAAGD